MIRQWRSDSARGVFAKNGRRDVAVELVLSHRVVRIQRCTSKNAGRLIGLLAGLCGMAVAGAQYGFNAFSDAFKLQLSLSQSEGEITLLPPCWALGSRWYTYT